MFEVSLDNLIVCKNVLFVIEWILKTRYNDIDYLIEVRCYPLCYNFVNN